MTPNRGGRRSGASGSWEPGAADARRGRWRAAAAAVVAVLIGALASSVGPARPAAAETVAIGLSVGLSGAFADEGRAMAAALELLVESVNATDATNGRTVEAIVLDDANDADRARANAEVLVADPRVVAVVGHLFSSVALATAEIYDRAGVPLLTPSASSPEVTRASPWLFSLNFETGTEGEMIATWLHRIKGVRRLAIVHGNDAYGTSLADAVQRTALRLGMAVPARHVFPDGGFADTVLARDLGAMLDVAVPDALAVMSHAGDGIAVVRALRRHGFDGPVIGPEDFAYDGVIAGLDGATAGLTVATPFLYETASLDTVRFVHRLRHALGQTDGHDPAPAETDDAWPSPWVPFAYDAARLVVDAVAAVGADRGRVRRHLAAIDRPARAVEGLTGRFYFDAFGAAVRPTLFARIADGRFRPEFRQLRRVVAPAALAMIERGRPPAGVVTIGRRPFHEIQVVYAGLDVYRVNDVDIRGQRFDLEGFLWLRWSGDLEPDEITFVNEIFSEENVRDELDRVTTDGVTYALYKVKSRFVANYDLRAFPFDHQALELRLAHRTRHADSLMLVRDAGRLSPNSITAIYPNEWLFEGSDSYGATYTINSSFGRPELAAGSRGPEFSVFATQVRLKRLIAPYIWAVFLPLGAMFCIAFLAFLIDASKFEARISLVTSALISVLVFHLAQMSTLPPVGYLLRIDHYFITAYVVMLALVVAVVASDRLGFSRRFESWFAAALFAAVILANVALTAAAAFGG